MKVVVVGASDLTEGVVRELTERGHQVVVFDDVKDPVERLEAELDITGAVVDLLNFDELERYGFSKADILILAHRDDSVNTILGMYAKIVNIPRVVAVLRSRRMAEVVTRLGLASRAVVIGEVVGEEVRSSIHGAKLIELPGGRVLAALDVEKLGRVVGTSVKDFRNTWDAVVVGIVDKEGLFKEPLDEYTFREGDVVIVLAERRRIEDMLL